MNVIRSSTIIVTVTIRLDLDSRGIWRDRVLRNTQQAMESVAVAGAYECRECAKYSRRTAHVIYNRHLRSEVIATTLTFHGWHGRFGFKLKDESRHGRVNVGLIMITTLTDIPPVSKTMPKKVRDLLDCLQLKYDYSSLLP